jgi:uncharacterized membrane protein
MLNLIYLFKKARDSFWFVPTLIIVCSIVSAIVLLYIDRTFPFEPEGVLRLIFSENSDSGRNVLTVIAGSMVGIAGTVFSITIVVLQLASSQLGPRLLRNFMYKRLNQVVLGQYVGVFLYSIIVINAIKDNSEYAFIPNISILFAIFLAIFNVFLLVIFIHSISMSIQPSKIINELRVRIEKNIQDLYPEQVEKEVTLIPKDDINNQLESIKKFKATTSGYIQYFDLDALVNIARKREIIIKILHRPGSYIVKGQEVFELFKNNSEAEFSEEDSLSLEKSYKVATKKSFFQDVEFGIHQIAEIASKALSPSINNPYTAAICIDNLTSVLCKLVVAKIPDAAIKDDTDVLRLIVMQNSFEGYLDTAFNLIRQYGKTSPFIMIALMEALKTILDADRNNTHTETLSNYAAIVMETGKKSFQLQTDIDDLEHRYTLFKTTI